MLDYQSHSQSEAVGEWLGEVLGHNQFIMSDLQLIPSIGSISKNQGRYEESLEWYGRALTGREKALGKEHPSTLRSVNNTAIAFDNKGRYGEATEWYRGALAGYKKVPGNDHPRTKAST